MTIADLLAEALEELGVLAPGESPSDEDSETALRRLNRLLDAWNADHRAIYVNTPATYVLTPSLQPHTIGSSGATFTVTSRPVSIEAANIVVDGIRHTPLKLRDESWWMGLSDPTLTGEIPSDLNYRESWPNGALYLWPVPTSAHTLELLTRGLLSAVAMSDTFTMPPGYHEAVVLTLAEKLAVPFERQVSPDLRQDARTARARVFGANDPDVRITLADAGMPGVCSGAGYDYRTGR